LRFKAHLQLAQTIGSKFIELLTATKPMFHVSSLLPAANFPPLIIAIIALSPTLLATDKEPTGKTRTPIVIPVTGAGQSTTTKVGHSFVTRTQSGQSFTTTQLGFSTITRDSKGNTWTTTKLGNSYVTRGPDGQRQTTSQLGNSFVTRDSKTGSTFTTSPLGNSLQTRGPGGSSYSTTPLGNSFITRGTSTKKDEPKGTRVIVVPSGVGR
jgi:hypothetical protein